MSDRKPDLVLKENESLHRPIEIVIHGKKYKSKVITKVVFNKLIELEKKGNQGDNEAPYEQVTLVFGVPKKILYMRDLKEISVINNLVTESIQKSELYRTESEKKENGLEG